MLAMIKPRSFVMSNRASPGLADEITKTAFERGREFHQAMFKKKRGDNWLSSVAAPSDIISLLEKSQQKYEKKLASRSKKLKEAVNWWMVASSRVQHYNQVISTVISSNPEYAAIVWGALGFLFQVGEISRRDPKPDHVTNILRSSYVGDPQP